MRLPWSGLLALALAGCGAEAGAQEPGFAAPVARRVAGGVEIRPDSLPFVHVEAVGDEGVGSVVRAPARVAFREDAVSEVGAPVDGRVTAVHVQVGQQVEAGDPLLEIASPSAAQVRAELARARVLVRAAETELARQTELCAHGVGIESDRVRAEADVAQARALLSGLTSTTASIGRGRAAGVVVRAPIRGTVLTRRASVGAAVEAGGEPLLVLGEPGALWVVASVFERDLPLVEVGSTARVALAARGQAAAGRVESLGGAVDPQTRRGPVYLALDESAAPELRAGMYARAEIEVGDAGIGIPTSSVLIEDGGRTVVYVQRGERTFEPREVQVGAPAAGRVPVLSGLERGERVVTRGALLLDGQAELLR